MSFQVKQCVTLSEASRILKLSVSLLQYYIRTNRFPKYEEVSGRKLFKRHDIEQWKPVYLKQGRPKEK